jgi:tRNA(Ile2) C34 agmatinyltransferase TiaS
LRVDYKKGKRWCTHCGQQVMPIGMNCPECGHMVRQSPRRSVYRKLFQGIGDLYSAPKIGLKTSTVTA